MSRARSTVAKYLSDYLQHDQITDPVPWIDPAITTQIEAAITKVGYERLRPIYDELNEQVPYESIRIVVTCWANRNKDQLKAE